MQPTYTWPPKTQKYVRRWTLRNDVSPSKCKLYKLDAREILHSVCTATATILLVTLWDACQRQLRSPDVPVAYVWIPHKCYCMLLLFFWHPTSMASSGRHKYIVLFVLYGTRKMHSHISPTPLISRGVKKYKIWCRFSPAVTFDVLWFQNAVIYQKCKTCVADKMIRLNTVSSISPLIFTGDEKVRNLTFKRVWFREEATYRKLVKRLWWAYNLHQYSSVFAAMTTSREWQYFPQKNALGKLV